MQQYENDWIEYIADRVHEHYEGRKVVLWGKYTESDSIKEKLKEKYQIETAFYVENDKIKIDNRQVFSTDYLKGKSVEFYVVVPLAVYDSVRELLMKSGYRPDLDYFYFSDCIVRQEEDYYEDAHGNKIIGRYAGMKFVFSGFDSVIEIGEHAILHEMRCYVHSNSRIRIGNKAKILDTSCYVGHDSSIVIGDSSQINKTGIRIESLVNVDFGCETCLTGFNMRMAGRTKWKTGSNCELKNWSVVTEQCVEILINDNTRFMARVEETAIWSLLYGSKIEIGNNGFFKYGTIHMEKNTLLKIGEEFNTQGGYKYILGEDTTITIGDECLFSNDIMMQSNDGHSIFDVSTGENINSTYEIRKSRKIVIGNHVWVGLGVSILYNTRIADGSVIGARSLVKGEIPNNCIAAGIPARITRRDIAWSRNNGSDNIRDCRQDYVHLTGEV